MSGPCVKQQVRASVVATNGQRFVGTNECATPQTVCPRAGMPTGVGYELCKSVCNQGGHAEAVALARAGEHASSGTLHLEGHTYVCDNCKAAANGAGIVALVIGTPP